MKCFYCSGRGGHAGDMCPRCHGHGSLSNSDTVRGLQSQMDDLKAIRDNGDKRSRYHAAIEIAEIKKTLSEIKTPE